jgi:inhibitor of cysteine peptidase
MALAEPNTANTMLSLTETDNNLKFAIRAGDLIEVTLPENATTGYRWAIDHYDRDIIEAVGSEPRYTSSTIGSGGDVVFTFKANKAGSAEIALKNWRHFQGDASVQKRYRLRIDVAP